jgi:hypothetical protein
MPYVLSTRLRHQPITIAHASFLTTRKNNLVRDKSELSPQRNGLAGEKA